MEDTEWTRGEWGRLAVLLPEDPKEEHILGAIVTYELAGRKQVGAVRGTYRTESGQLKVRVGDSEESGLLLYPDQIRDMVLLPVGMSSFWRAAKEMRSFLGKRTRELKRAKTTEQRAEAAKARDLVLQALRLLFVEYSRRRFVDTACLGLEEGDTE